MVDGKRKYVLLHRLIMARVVGRELSRHELTDHINMDTFNNSRSNLRLATHQQNQYNVPKRKDNTSGYKGVTYVKRLNKWGASIKANGKAVNLGYFETPEEAHAKYCEKAKELHGEYFRSE